MNTKTLVIDNFRGSMTAYKNGDINSGRSWEQVCSGQNPFLKPGQLTWSASPVQIDPNGTVITDLIVTAKERTESGILYVYAVGHLGRVYKIQVNNPSGFNPDYDNPVLLATITSNSPTFTRGGSIEFFGATERMYIGHDVGMTRLDFDGTNETFVGSVGSWTQSVPRPLKQFIGKLYAGNGSNLAEVDSTGAVTSYTKLSPGFQSNTQVRDIDVSPDGIYLESVVSTLPLFDITSSTQETVSTANANSFIYKWNGTDVGYTTSVTYPSFVLSSNILFQNYQYTFGTDQFGSAIYNPQEKIISIPESPAPLPNAVYSTGNLLVLMTPVYFANVLQGYMLVWGSNDFEVGNPLGFWSPFFLVAASPETDIVRIPCVLPVSNTGFGASSNGYTKNVYGTAKTYFSTLETSSAPTTKYRFYKWNVVTSTQSPVQNAIYQGLYQTQNQLFSEKINVIEVRIYSEPWVTNNSFTIDLIGSSGNPITNASRTFTVGTNISAGDDFIWYNPSSAPTYTLGVAITNLGTANFVINKIEIDYTQKGK